ncbi:MAG: hypothetical protein IJ521_04775, partial [Schwartzia sp.]|nr:hypothetical protein [Schwartzia sp. (in: firmicutes)]
NPQKYDAYCFGSSRVGKIDLRKIENGLRYYNMTYSGGLPGEWLGHLKLFLKHRVTMRQLLLGIDEFSFRNNPKAHETQYLRIPYRDEGNIKTYLSYLLKEPFILPEQEESKRSIFDIYGTGMAFREDVDEKIEQDVAKHIQDPKFLKPMRSLGNRIDETIAELETIKTLCNQNGIELIVFINPIHNSTYLATNLAEFNEFKQRLSEITDYYDFSGLNEITTNNYYYYETSHYRPIVGDMIIQRIFYPERETDFGVFVTKANVAEHIRALEQQVTGRE